MGSEAVPIDAQTPSPLGTGTYHLFLGLPGKGELVALTHLDIQRRLLPTLYLNCMQQLTEINKLTSSCGELAGDGRNGPTEGSKLWECDCRGGR